MPVTMPSNSEISPLSALQSAMLRVSIFENSGANVEQVEILFSPQAPMDRVPDAWQATVKHSAALQAAFVFNDGDPCGIRQSSVEPEISIRTIYPNSWESWLSSDREQPLPLDGGPPWRVSFWPRERKFVWTFHHALLDGRSITKILRAFLARLGEDEDPGFLSLAKAAVPTDGEIEAALAFHREAFAEVDSKQPEFPGDDERTPARVQKSLGADLAARLEATASDMGVTAATLITWAWGQAVATAAGADRAAIGQVRSGPPKPGQAGFSMNTVPLVIARAGRIPVDEEIRDFRLKLLAMRAVENVSPQHLPPGIFQETNGPWPGGVLMVEIASPMGQLGHSALIESVKLHEYSGEPLLASAWIHPELRIEVEVNGSPHGPKAARILLELWASIITGTVNAADSTLLPFSMRQDLEKLETDSEATCQLHLTTAWKEAVEIHGDQCAIISGDESLTYREVDTMVGQLAARLHNAGAGYGVTIACLLRNRKFLAIVLLACARVGAIHVPLDPVLPGKRLLSIVGDAEPLLVLSDDPSAGEEFSLPFLPIEGTAGPGCTAEIFHDPLDPLALLYTSGSTGNPKGVIMVHGGVINEAMSIAKLAGIKPGDRVLQFASPGFDASLEEVLATLLSGATLVPRPDDLASDIDGFQRFIHGAGITILDLSTAYWATWCVWMVSGNKRIPPSVRSVIIGGERASASALSDWFTAKGREHLLINTYGPTEASVVATAELIMGDWSERGDPAIGRPLPGVHARICDAAGRQLPPGAAGELWLGGICVGPGYWKRPDRTEIAFREVDGRRFYRTGDRAYWDDEGKLRFLGRQDEQLKIRGFRIEPNEVIRILEGHPGVIAAHAGPIPGHAGSPLLAAWIRWNAPPADGWPSLLASHAASHLAAASIPTRWAAVDDFHLTERGKLDRSKLPEPSLTASSNISSEPAATPTEIDLSAIWSGILGVKQVGRDESFFEIGGNSLAALQLFARIAKEWEIRIPMAILIQAPTLRLLAGIIDFEKNSAAMGTKAEKSIVIPVKPNGHLPPLFCIHGGDGGVFFYRDMGKHMPSDRPLLAIESPALAMEDEVVPVSIEETAALYLAEIRRHQPQGPYFLAGYSYGGLLVHEIARQIIAMGERIGFAAMFDTVNPAAPIRKYSMLERMNVFWNSQEHANCFDRCARLISRIRSGIATNIRIKTEVRSAHSVGFTEPHSELRMLQVREAHGISMRSFTPKHLDCRISLFKSRAVNDKFEIPMDYGWGVVVASLDMVEVPGEHLTMFSEENVAILAREVSKRLENNS